jgi:hypothetical protein
MLAVLLCGPVATGVAVRNNLALRDIAKRHDQDVSELYLLLLIQARQIRTLQNFRMRDLSPELQQKLEDERLKFSAK